ncbi:HEAT repeat domain-containing protein [Calothrix rhizosoleniae]|uniref:HEAT repeat domain-containing protein n=1 Tax=Calothrix rhizosoleniae TaxID=888997 RepID=UPI001F2AB375|nr:HEAT repeat domain-containing protein [Calothrix rhizosoleniae]
MNENITAIDSPQPIDNSEAAIAALKNSDDSGIRYYAAWWLGKNRIQEAISLLCECLQDERDITNLGGYPLRRQAARSLGMLKDSQAVPPLIKALDCSDPKVQEVVIQALKDIGDIAAVPALINLLNAEKEDKPVEALIEALTAFKVWQVQEQIEPFLQHSSERVKCAAAQYFYALTLEPRYLEMLFQTLGHENRFLRYAAAFDLAALGQVTIAPAIIKAHIPNNIKLATLKRILESLLQDKAEIEVKRQEQENFLFQTIDELLLDAIEGNIPRSNTVEANREIEKIKELVNQPNANSQQVPESPISALIEALKSPYPNVKAAAIKGLVQLAPVSVDTIIQIFETDEDGDLRAGLIQVLIQIGDSRTLSLLEKVIGFEVGDHCQGKIRRVAARGLGKIGRQTGDAEIILQAIATLKGVLSQPDDWALRYSAAASLEEIGNSDAISVLQAASERESDLVVQTRIKRALAYL